jgi:putative transposase
MQEYSSTEVKTLIQSEAENSLESMLREGARRMLQTALEMEVSSYLEGAREDRDASVNQAVVRNGHHRERTLVSGVGPLTIQQPRVHDRRSDHQFTRAILPRYMRRTPSIDALVWAW